MKKVCMLVILSLIVNVFTQGPVYAKKDFYDVPEGSWYEENVGLLVEDSRMIIKGFEDGSFRPNDKLTTDQFITMVVRASGYNLEVGDEYWAQPFIDKAIELEYITEGEYKNYRQEITREEMSPIVNRVVDSIYPKHTYTQLDKIEEVLVDVESITPKYKEDVLKCYELGIITGFSDYTFRGSRVLTRAEACTVLIRIIIPDKRQVFNYNEIKVQLTGIESFYKGGTNWINPITQENVASYILDESHLTSNIDYNPGSISASNGDPRSVASEDYFNVYIKFNEVSVADKHDDDVEYLLKRRLSEENADRVLTYVFAKKNISDLYINQIVVFSFDQYDVLVREMYSYSPSKGDHSETVYLEVHYKDSHYLNDTRKLLEEGFRDGSVYLQWEE